MNVDKPDVTYNGVVEIELGGQALMVYFKYIPFPAEMAITHEPKEMLCADAIIRLQHSGLDITDMLSEACGSAEQFWDDITQLIQDSGYEFIARPGSEVTT